MPRKGPAYPFTEDWQGWVRDRIEQMIRDGEIPSQNAFAKKAGISKASLSEALKPGAKQTAYMPEIHKALGWPMPLRSPPNHVIRLVEFFTELPELEQGRWLEKIRQEVEEERARAQRTRW